MAARKQPLRGATEPRLHSPYLKGKSKVDDVIELAEVIAEIGDVALNETDILQARGGEGFLGELDLATGKIDADEFRLGIQLRHGQRVDTAAATEFQNARVARIGRGQGKNAANGGETSDVGIGKAIGRIRNRIVSGQFGDVAHGDNGGFVGWIGFGAKGCKK